MLSLSDVNLNRVVKNEGVKISVVTFGDLGRTGYLEYMPLQDTFSPEQRSATGWIEVTFLLSSGMPRYGV